MKKMVVGVFPNEDLIPGLSAACAAIDIELKTTSLAMDALRLCLELAPQVVIADLPLTDALWSEFYDAVSDSIEGVKIVLLIPEGGQNQSWMEDHELDLTSLPTEVFAWLPETTEAKDIASTIDRAFSHCSSYACALGAGTCSSGCDAVSSENPINQDSMDDVDVSQGVDMELSYAELLERCRYLEKSSKSINSNIIRAGDLATAGMQLIDVCQHLNEQMNVILGFSEILQDDNLCADDTQKNIVSTIHNKAQEASAVLRRVLSVVQRAPFHSFDVADCNIILDNVLSARKHVLSLNNVKVSIFVSRRPLYLQCDDRQIEMMLMHLLMNAEQSIEEKAQKLREKHHMDGGDLEVALDAESYQGSISITVDSGARNSVRFTVEDNGHGADPLLLGSKGNPGRIFEPFFTTSADNERAGLGLAICATIVTSHEGTIHAENIGDGQGFRVVVELPSESNKMTYKTRALSTLESDGIGEGYKILVVEDDPLGAKLSRSFLERYGFEVTLAQDGISGLELASSGIFDAVVTDYRLPGLNGCDLYISLVKKCPELRQRVVFVTGFVLDVSVREFLRGSGCCYLVKPVSCWELLGAVKKCLGLQEDTSKK